MKVVKRDLQEAVGSVQLCAGQDAGCEAAVHAMEHLFTGDDTEANYDLSGRDQWVQSTEQTGDPTEL